MGARTIAKTSFYVCSIIDKSDADYKLFMKQSRNQDLDVFFKIEKRNPLTNKYDFEMFTTSIVGVYLHSIKESSFTSKSGEFYNMLTFTFFDKKENSYWTFRLFKNSVFAKTLVSRLVNLVYYPNNELEIGAFEVTTKEGKTYINAKVYMDDKILPVKTPKDISNVERDAYYEQFLTKLLDKFGKQQDDDYTVESEYSATNSDNNHDSDIKSNQNAIVSSNLQEDDDVPF